MEDEKDSLGISNTNMQVGQNLSHLKRNVVGSLIEFSNQEKEIDESFKDLDLKIAIIKEKASSIMRNIKIENRFGIKK